MAIDFMKSKTRENLMKAFAGESQARNRYTIAARVAKRQGMPAISVVFKFTADQERAHAQRFYELLKECEGTAVDICGGFPVDTYDTLTGLLESARHNEMEEYEDVYRSFGDTAREEGFHAAAAAFHQIAKIELIHAKRFEMLRRLLAEKEYFQQENGTWMCLNCGYIHKGSKAPGECPVCLREKGYFIPVELAPYTCSQLYLPAI